MKARQQWIRWSQGWDMQLRVIKNSTASVHCKTDQDILATQNFSGVSEILWKEKLLLVTTKSVSLKYLIQSISYLA